MTQIAKTTSPVLRTMTGRKRLDLEVAVCGNNAKVADFYLFDIGGNKFRLIAAAQFNVQKLYVRHNSTHEEYDKWRP
jgi:mRNA-degrading endonuclease HigB of HigAB toxin-antitoxin module